MLWQIYDLRVDILEIRNTFFRSSYSVMVHAAAYLGIRKVRWGTSGWFIAQDLDYAWEFGGKLRQELKDEKKRTEQMLNSKFYSLSGV